MRIGSVELHEFPEQNSSDVRHAHRCAGMPTFGLLHGIHRQKPNAIGHIA
jgi:hypothetical protein